MTANPFRAAQRAVKGEIDRLEGLRALFETLGEGADLQKAINDKHMELAAAEAKLADVTKSTSIALEAATNIRELAESDAKAIVAAAEATKAEVSKLIDEAREEARKVIADAREAAKREQEGAAAVLAEIRAETDKARVAKAKAEDELAQNFANIDNAQARLAGVQAEIDALKKRFAS